MSHHAGLTVGEVTYRPFGRVLVIAEAGINHNGDLDLAHRLIDTAADAGADACKFQNYRTEDFVADPEQVLSYESAGVPVQERLWELFKRHELDPAHLEELSAHCADRGIAFLSTPTSSAGIDELLAVGVPALKNGSDYLTNLDLVAAMARTGLPTILSTGMSTAAEVDDAVRAHREAGGGQLALLHCTSSYPTPPAEANLRKIPALAAAFDVPVGFSDHTEGITAAIAAVALGACVVEKHITLSHDMPGPDHRFSADPAQLTALVQGVRDVSALLGTSRLGPTEQEGRGRLEHRLSCVAGRPLPAGAVLTRGDVAFKRPGTGVVPGLAPLLLGRTLRAQVPAGHVFDAADFR